MPVWKVVLGLSYGWLLLSIIQQDDTTYCDDIRIAFARMHRESSLCLRLTSVEKSRRRWSLASFFDLLAAVRGMARNSIFFDTWGIDTRSEKSADVIVASCLFFAVLVLVVILFEAVSGVHLPIDCVKFATGRN